MGCWSQLSQIETPVSNLTFGVVFGGARYLSGAEYNIPPLNRSYQSGTSPSKMWFRDERIGYVMP